MKPSYEELVAALIRARDFAEEHFVREGDAWEDLGNALQTVIKRTESVEPSALSRAVALQDAHHYAAFLSGSDN